MMSMSNVALLIVPKMTVSWVVGPEVENVPPLIVPPLMRSNPTVLKESAPVFNVSAVPVFRAMPPVPPLCKVMLPLPPPLVTLMLEAMVRVAAAFGAVAPLSPADSVTFAPLVMIEPLSARLPPARKRTNSPVP